MSNCLRTAIVAEMRFLISWIDFLGHMYAEVRDIFRRLHSLSIGEEDKRAFVLIKLQMKIIRFCFH